MKGRKTKKRPFSSYSVGIRKRKLREVAEQLKKRLPEIQERLLPYHGYIESEWDIIGMSPQQIDIEVDRLSHEHLLDRKYPGIRSALNDRYKTYTRFLRPRIFQSVTRQRIIDYLESIRRYYGQQEYDNAVMASGGWNLKKWEDFFKSEYYKEQNIYNSDGDTDFFEDNGVVPMTAALYWFEDSL